MKTITINKKTLSNPSFYWISNLGGGGSDKYRETVYLDLYNGIPTLYNYYYLKYPKFANKWLSHIERYESFGDFLKFAREDMINSEGFISKKHIPLEYDYQNNVYLLDSGARNILNDIIRNKIERSGSIEETMIDKMYEYYDFADRFKFDFVIGFDLGGKYTFKDNERTDQELLDATSSIDSDELNFELISKTIEYLENHPNYYPKIYATIHGSTPKEYENYIKKVTELEKKTGFTFYGYALGGIASSKNLDKQWINNDLRKEIHNPAVIKKALSIVKKYSGEKPIHVLGGGNKDNIPTLFFGGANSFDCQTPGRRAYDGNEQSTKLVYDANATGSFSKYLPALFDQNEVLEPGIDYNYTAINKIGSAKLCSCPSCKLIDSFTDIKKLYSNKEKSNEDYYYSRQLINAHSIWQHYYLINFLSSYKSFQNVCDKNSIEFFDSLKQLF